MKQNTQQKAEAARRAESKSKQRIRHAQSSPSDKEDVDDLSTEELVARQAAQLEAAGAR